MITPSTLLYILTSLNIARSDSGIHNTKVRAVMAEDKKHRRTVEVRSYSDGEIYHIVVDGHYDVLMKLELPFHGKINEFLQEAHNNYMPVMTYDDNNSEIRQFDHNYVRVTHKMNFHKANEIRPIMREQISDILLNDGWDLLGFGCHPGPIPRASTIIEKWVKNSKV